MKLVQAVMVGLVITFPSALATGAETASLNECLSLAPTGEQFSISLEMSVDTSKEPILKNGNLGVRNDKGPKVSAEEKQEFQPMIECLVTLLKS